MKKNSDPQPAVLKRYRYRYDGAGNRSSEQIDDVVTGAVYDTRNRLLAHSATGSLHIAGTLSEIGVVTVDGKPAMVDAANAFEGAKTVSAGTNTFTVVATDYSGNSTSRTFEVPATGSGETFTHDANGNLTSDGTRAFEWDAENRLVAVVNGTHRSEFAYDGYSRRIRMIEKENSVVVRDAHLLWANSQIIEERLTTGETNRFFVNGEQHNGTARYLTRDHLASVREATDAAASIVVRNDYDPYGRLSRSGSEDTRFGFTGHMNHVPSGLALALYHAYDPEAARWTSADPIGFAGGLNVYQYVRSNPITYVDPDGLNPLAGALEGAKVGGTVGGPYGAIAGGIIGAAIGWYIGQAISNAIVDITGKPPFTGDPGSIVRGDRQTRRYGPDGYPETDVDVPHGHKPDYPHAHDWDRPSDGSTPKAGNRGDPRPLKPGDPPKPRRCP